MSNPRSGLVALVTHVRNYFLLKGIDANVPPLGWKERTKQINQGIGGANRVVFVPSGPNGAAGPLASIRGPGKRLHNANSADAFTRRGLYNWERQAGVSIWGIDRSNPLDIENEEAQIEATELLFERVIEAVHYFVASSEQQFGGYATVEWGEPTWVTPPNERVFGRELLAPLTLKHPMFAEEVGYAYPERVVVTRDPAA